ncbi:MAG: 1-deoxy-D-xylulose-5-phosphate reductoisomerase [Candidatus Melainabacteria bacterium]|jgi:1-deoxy-D-xylulose-5-phosphate reductoisomerase|nr:1-deoxy-D-xylulose-5-phosphate reductoisomerase [Candidatus Melainabacteria bacterium]
MKKISIIGSTGSIGTQTIDVVASQPDRLQVVALAAGKRNLDLLKQQIIDCAPDLVSLPDTESARLIHDWLGSREYQDAGKKKNIEVMAGHEGLMAVACHPEAELLVTAVVGFLGVEPTLAAIAQGKTIALANKETMVAAGHLVNEAAAKSGARIIPVDSEHSAIFQSLESSLLKGRMKEEVHAILLTGSGGPFRTWSLTGLQKATKQDALKHPNWSMGAKITIDSATLMNKGLEYIEARWLFDIDADKIKVVIHPQSILHSAVEFVDGSIVGQLGVPDMRIPIHFAIFHPERVHSPLTPRLNLTQLKDLTFEPPDLHKFACLRLAMEVAKTDDSSACVLNAANEVLVDAFLADEVGFLDIGRHIEAVLDEHKPIKRPSLPDILQCDRWARERAREHLTSLKGARA